MAERRMIHKRTVQSLQFISMGKAAQALYMQLVADADDDGCVEAGAVLRMTRTRRTALQELVENNFVTVLVPSKDIVYVNNWQRFNTVDSRYIQYSLYRETLRGHLPDIKLVEYTGKDKASHTGNSRISKYSISEEKSMECSSSESEAEGIPTKQTVITELTTTYYAKPSEAEEIAERFIGLNEKHNWKQLSTLSWKSVLQRFMVQEKSLSAEEIAKRKRRAEQEAEEERRRKEEAEKYWQEMTYFPDVQDFVEYIKGGKYTQYDWELADTLHFYSVFGQGDDDTDNCFTADDIAKMRKCGIIRVDMQAGVRELFSEPEIKECDDEKLVAKIRSIQRQANMLPIELRDKPQETYDYYDEERLYEEANLPFS